MKPILLVGSMAALFLSALAFAASAAGDHIDLLGDPAPPAAAGRTVVITPNVDYVNVTSGDIVKFVVGTKSFTWDFDTENALADFDLNRVAPAGMLDHTVKVYIAPDRAFVGGG
jgi:hypothetical protein